LKLYLTVNASILRKKTQLPKCGDAGKLCA
jgi:hypothetical protein